MKYLLLSFFCCFGLFSNSYTQIKKRDKEKRTTSFTNEDTLKHGLTKPIKLITTPQVDVFESFYNNKFLEIDYNQKLLNSFPQYLTLNPYLSPLEQLKSIYKNDTLNLLYGGINFKNFYGWFTNEVPKLKNRYNSLEIPFSIYECDSNSAAFFSLVRKIDTTINYYNYKSHITFLEESIKSISCVPIKVWGKLLIGRILVSFNSKDYRYYVIRDSIVEGAKKLFDTETNACNKSTSTSYIGDYFNGFREYDSAIYYYRKAQTDMLMWQPQNYNNLYLPELHGDFSMKLGDTYANLNFYNDFFSDSYYRMASNDFSLKPKNEKNDLVKFKLLEAEFYRLYFTYYNYDSVAYFKELNRICYSLLDAVKTLLPTSYQEKRIFNRIAAILLRNEESGLFLKAKQNEVFYSIIGANNRTERSYAYNSIRDLSNYNSWDQDNFSYKLHFDRLTNNRYENYYTLIDRAYSHLEKNEIKDVESLLKYFDGEQIDTTYLPRFKESLYSEINLLKYKLFAVQKENIDSIIYYSNLQNNNVSNKRLKQYWAVNAENTAQYQELNNVAQKRKELYDLLSIEKQKAIDEKIKANIAVENENFARRKAEFLAYQMKKLAQTNDSLKQRALDSALIAQNQRKETQKFADSLNVVNIKLDSTMNKLKASKMDLEEKNRKINRQYIFTSILGGIVLVFMGLKNKQTKQLKDEENEKLRALNELNITKAKLNPHFIHNLLAELKFAKKRIINEQESDLFFDNVAKFVKTAYEANNKKFTTYNEELNLIDMLVDFYNKTKHFSNPVTFQCDRNYDYQDGSDFLLPPLLLFNYAQNALKDAFRKSNENLKKILSINFSDSAIELKDNGSGFVLADAKKYRPTGGISMNEKIINHYNSLIYKTTELCIDINSSQETGTVIKISKNKII